MFIFYFFKDLVNYSIINYRGNIFIITFFFFRIEKFTDIGLTNFGKSLENFVALE